MVSCTVAILDDERDRLDAMTTEVSFDDVIETAPKFLEGKVRGRIVVPVCPELG